jgi:hypothetical protein|tara:strand:- start:643 stop:1398 length:756 start_codon:yes stop_codon:yes gene_type:complete
MKKTYFNHDSNARNDIRIIKLRAKLGYEGYGIFWSLLELLFTEENKLCIEDYDTLAFGLQCDSVKLKQVIEDFDLFIIEDKCFYSKRLNSHIKEINTKSSKAKDSASKRWNNASAMRSHSDSNASISISKVNKSNSINKRLEDFKKSIHAIEGISDEDKNDFFLYWTEKNKSGSKFRAEMQTTFDINLRLKRWASNGFNKNQKNKHLDYWDQYTYKKLDSTGKQEYMNHLKELGFESIYSPTAGTTFRKKK